MALVTTASPSRYPQTKRPSNRLNPEAVKGIATCDTGHGKIQAMQEPSGAEEIRE